MGSKRFHRKPAPFRAVQIKISVMIQARGTRSTPPDHRRYFHAPLITEKPRVEHALDFVAVAAAGFVALLGSDEDGRGGGGGGVSVYQALGARGVPAAAGADGAQLHHL